jgi:anaerobic magnesium-protoporphyrin IX monomethyl ester cyclase
VLSEGWLLRRYPWAGSLSTAHTVLYYDRYGYDVFRRLASTVRGGVIGARPEILEARFDLAAAARALSREGKAWHRLVRVQREVSRAAYGALIARAPTLGPKARRYRVMAGEAPVPVRMPPRARRSSNSPNALG